MIPRWSLTAAVALGALLGACGGTPTQIVVVVESDLEVPGELDAVDIVVVGGPDRSSTVTALLDGPAAVRLPLTLGVVPRSDENAEITVTAVGRAAGSEVVRQTTSSRFTAGQVRTIVLRLLRRCVTMRCETGQTCDAAGCRAIAVEPSALPRWTGQPPDAGLPDGGCPPGVDLRSDPLNCGSCGNVCPTVQGAAATCTDGVCGSSCGPGFHPCTDGCQPDESVDACGPTCTACPELPDASATCDGIACGFRCDPGFADCDVEAATGCETDVQTASDCGGCDIACAEPTPLCGRMPDGNRTCVGACAADEMRCGDICVDTATDARHCGECGNECPTPDNGAAACAAGRCGLACDLGFHACGAGCVSDSSPASCGLRCEPCPAVAGATATCRLGECGFLCETGLGDCDAMVAGCETDLRTSATSCGSCGNVCDLPFAVEGCTSGACTVVSCDAGRDDCNSMPDDGCEADLSSTTACGLCGHACGTGFTCSMGVCSDDIVAVAAGADHTCAVMAGGSVRCWGASSFGQLGGTPPMGSSIATVSGIGDAVEVVAGAQFACARRATGAVLCWGRGDVGQLGDGRTGAGIQSSAPVVVMSVPDAVSIAAGAAFACAVRADGSVLCWGEDASGQLGDGMSGEPRGLPSQVMSVTDAVQVGAGDAHACVRGSGRNVRCWGLGTSGQLGNAMLVDSAAPVDVATLADAIAVTGGARHSCAARAMTTLCWGANDHGQLGDGSMATANSTPVVVMSLTGLVRAGDAGGDTSCLAIDRGATFCWGAGDRGQLGIGELRPEQRTPVMVVGLTDARSVSCGARHCCAGRDGGGIVCWGANEAGQTGTAMSGDVLVPMAVVGLR